MPRAERDLEHLLRPSAAGVGLEVAAVEPTAVQLVWSQLEAGPHILDVGGRRLRWDHPGGPGSIVVDELEPSTELRVTLRSERQEVLASCSTATSAAPPGARMCRIATISDLHLGRDTHRARHLEAATPPSSSQAPTPREPDAARDPADRSPLASLDEDRASRCARAAIAEAVDWGAQLIVVKGDVCEETVAHTWDLAAALLTGLPVPVVVLPGNHDTGRLRHFEPEHGAAERGLEVLRGVGHVDMPGLRVVAVDSTRPGTSWGSVDRHADEVAELVRSAGPALVATHHQPQRFTVPLYWPPGIPGPDARRFARAVRAANPSVLATSGHTHRNVRRRVAGMDWTEVASTSHYPGVWAGYTVHEGGLHQTVRRIADPATLEWSERTRRMLRGVWALWSAGSLEDRCFTKVW